MQSEGEAVRVDEVSYHDEVTWWPVYPVLCRGTLHDERVLPIRRPHLIMTKMCNIV